MCRSVNVYWLYDSNNNTLWDSELKYTIIITCKSSLSGQGMESEGGKLLECSNVCIVQEETKLPVKVRFR